MIKGIYLKIHETKMQIFSFCFWLLARVFFYMYVGGLCVFGAKLGFGWVQLSFNDRLNQKSVKPILQAIHTVYAYIW